MLLLQTTYKVLEEGNSNATRQMKNRGVWENKLASRCQDDLNVDLSNSKACVLFISSLRAGRVHAALAAVGSSGPC